MNDPREVLSRPAPPPDVVLRYGPGREQIADLRLPPGRGPAPLILLLHGGFWRAEYDRTHLGPLATALAEHGYLVCTPEFRRTGQQDGGWPGTFDDIALATDTLSKLVASSAEVDGDRIALVGHSAGGHLALWAASRHRLPPGSPWRRSTALPIRGVLSLAGISDVTECARRELDDCAAQLLLGGEPEEVADRYAAADPMRLLPTGQRTVLLHGTDDVIVPLEMSRRYVEAATATGDDASRLSLGGIEHFGPIDPRSAAWPAVISALEGLMSPC